MPGQQQTRWPSLAAAAVGSLESTGSGCDARDEEGGNEMTSGTPRPPAGWHPDPTDQNRIRYWDGANWTEHTQPLAQGSKTPPASTAKTLPWWQSWWAVIPGLVLCAP